jgi:acetyl esterase/lipase
MFSSLVPTELAHKLAAVHAAVALWLHRQRVPLVSRWSGAAAVLAQCVVLAQLAGMYRVNLSSRRDMQRALASAAVAPDKLARVGEMGWRRWLSVFLPLPQPMALAVSFPGVYKAKTVAYAHVGKLKTDALLMDVYRHRDTPANAPVFVYIHGGGWVIGDRRIPPFTFVHQVVALGWVVCVIDYRLSPMVSFPTHLIDCKRAIAYLRRHARLELQANPEFIVVGGESAGGHLASLVALTAEDKRFQPGFEEVDTSVRGCVDNYGVHDFKDRFGLWYARDKKDGMIRYLEFLVMQKKLKDAEDDFERASPVAYLDADVFGGANARSSPIPPFFVCHGTHDNMVPFEDSRLFFEHLQAFRARQSDAHKAHEAAQFGGMQDVFVRVPFASHMFNFFLSPRALAFGDAVCAFLTDLHDKTSGRSPHSRFFSDVPEVPAARAASATSRL